MLITLKASIDATGEPLTDEALTAAKNADAVILGAIGGPVCTPLCTPPTRLSNQDAHYFLAPSRNGALAPCVLNKASSDSAKK